MQTFTEMAQAAIASSEDKKEQFKYLKQAAYEATGQYLSSTVLIEKLNQTRADLAPKVDMQAFLAS
jgi:hypothetical protein